MATLSKWRTKAGIIEETNKTFIDIDGCKDIEEIFYQSKWHYIILNNIFINLVTFFGYKFSVYWERFLRILQTQSSLQSNMALRVRSMVEVGFLFS